MRTLQIKEATVTIYPSGYAVIEGKNKEGEYEMYEFQDMQEIDFTKWQIAC